MQKKRRHRRMSVVEKGEPKRAERELALAHSRTSRNKIEKRTGGNGVPGSPFTAKGPRAPPPSYREGGQAKELGERTYRRRFSHLHLPVKKRRTERGYGPLICAPGPPEGGMRKNKIRKRGRKERSQGGTPLLSLRGRRGKVRNRHGT